jgi:hypothetical protein
VDVDDVDVFVTIDGDVVPPVKMVNPAAVGARDAAEAAMEGLAVGAVFMPTRAVSAAIPAQVGARNTATPNNIFLSILFSHVMLLKEAK